MIATLSEQEDEEPEDQEDEEVMMNKGYVVSYHFISARLPIWLKGDDYLIAKISSLGNQTTKMVIRNSLWVLCQPRLLW